MNLESKLLSLTRELESRNYELSQSSCFICNYPVKREIVAADFRDRVVHHLLFNWLNPICERFFIYDTYSCRKGKGTHFGIERARGFMRSVSDDYRKEAWVIKLDIRGFFMSINRRRLYEILCHFLAKNNYGGVDDPELCKYLLEKTVFHDPFEKVLFKSPQREWIGLPADKSLRHSPPGVGLPIGNITSQLFANVYLNPLDHFVKRE